MIKDSIKTEGSRVHDSFSGEIEFWTTCNAKYNMIYQQLNTNEVKTILRILGSKDSSEAEAFKHQQKEFEEQHHFMAEDYVKLLTSLEGQFKNISSGELKVIELTIPSVYKSL